MSDYPSLNEQGKNLAKFAFEVLKFGTNGNNLLCSNEVVLERRAICEGCDRRDPIPNRCRECGCYLDAKIRFALDSCPLGKWKESDKDWMNGEFQKFLEETEKNCCNEEEQTQ